MMATAMAPTSGLTLKDFVPGRTDRALFVGQTGSGKTTLARALLAYRRYVVVYDGKGTLNWKGYKLIRDLEKLHDVDPKEFPRIIYRPQPDVMQDEVALGEFFQFCYDRGNTTVYIDETNSTVISGRPMTFAMRACLTRGRERGVEVWCASQRAHWVPLEVMSEAEHVYAFKLKMRNDRVRVEDFSAIPEQDIYDLSKQEFLYSPQDGQVTGPYRLNLTKAGSVDMVK